MRISPREPARHDNGASDVWALKTLFNIVEEGFKKLATLLNFDVSAVL